MRSPYRLENVPKVIQQGWNYNPGFLILGAVFLLLHIFSKQTY